MSRRILQWLAVMALFLGCGWLGPASSAAQIDQGRINRMLVQSYDLLEAGKLDRAKAIFAQILKQDPGNPLVLNNLGAVLVKQNQDREALKYFKQALPRAGGYRVKINRVCDLGSVCLAFRPDMAVYGNQELLPLVQMNIRIVEDRLSTRK